MEMPDANGMGYNCYANYGNKQLGCAPTTFAGQRPPDWWSENPCALAIEWTERFLKVYWFPDYMIPDDLDTDYPKPETWDEKYIISYFPFAASEEKHNGSCPNPADVLGAQKLILNIELSGNWAGAKWQSWDQDPYHDEWRGKRDRGECKVHGCHTGNDCCSLYLGQSKMDAYLAEHAYIDISYLKIFELKTGPAPPPPTDMRRRGRAAPAPSPGKCVNLVRGHRLRRQGPLQQGFGHGGTMLRALLEHHRLLRVYAQRLRRPSVADMLSEGGLRHVQSQGKAWLHLRRCDQGTNATTAANASWNVRSMKLL